MVKFPLFSLANFFCFFKKMLVGKIYKKICIEKTCRRKLRSLKNK